MSKKTLLIIVSVVLVLSLIDNITAKDNANYQSIYDKTEKHFFSMKEFRNEYKLDKMKAMEKIKLKTDWLINRENKNEVNYIERFGYDPDYPSISFPHFKQKNSYYCGPASALTALYFQGSGNRVGGNGYIEKQDTIAKDADTSMGSKYKPGGTFVYKLTNAINNYSKTRYFYETRINAKELDNLIYDSLRYGNAPILHSLMENMPYYGGRTGGHYVTIVYYVWRAPSSENGIEVMDNNRDDRFFGTNRISFNDVYEMIYHDRYIIVSPER